MAADVVTRFYFPALVTGLSTYRFLRLPLVTLHLHLELIDEILQSDQVLLVFLSLQEREMERRNPSRSRGKPLKAGGGVTW